MKLVKTRFYKFVICRNCDVILSDPMPTEKELKKLYDKDYYVFSEARKHKDVAIAKEHLHKLLGHRKSGSLLDIGCGKGYFLNEAKKKGFQVQGVEISKPARNFGVEKLGLQIYNGTIEDFKPNKKYDIITMYDLIEHLPNSLTSLKKVTSLLKENGLLIVETPNFDSVYRQLSPFTRFWSGYNQFHIVFFNPRSASYIMKKAGLKPSITTSNASVFSKDAIWKSGLAIFVAAILRNIRFKRSVERMRSIKDSKKKVSTKKKKGFLDKLFNKYLMGDILEIYASKK
ncbi:class I SAM-dependent methyltransferase [archaeon]|nr:class I SAM-dependent methyltransferase [archaeon]